jgi:hypothetical protein
MDVECDGARASVEIVEEIIDNVRPWSRAKAAVYNGVVNELSGLLMVQEIRRNRLSRGTESKKAIRELEPALRVLIDIVNRVPAKFLASRERSELLGILQTLRARLEHRRQVIKRLPKKYDLTKNSCAQSAYAIIERFSDRPPTGTVDGPLRTVASLLYEVATGKAEVDLKRACDATLKRMRVRDKNEVPPQPACRR